MTPTEEQIASFRQDGHILLRSALGTQYVSELRQAVMNAVARLNTEARPLDERDTYGRAFIQITNIWEKDGEVRSLVLDPRPAQIAARLLGSERVRLYHDQALIKEPKGGRTPWHRDQFYWPLTTRDTVTIWIPLDDVDADMGSMTFASRSHRLEAAGEIGISDSSEIHYQRLIETNNLPTSKCGAMTAGDCSFHYGQTIHSAGPNLSATKSREVMTIIYFADGAVVAEPQNANQLADLEAFLGGRRPGQLADSEQNPLVG